MNSPVKPPTPEQLEDWAEGPVTVALLGLCEKELQLIRDTSATDCLFYGDPQKTQENLVNLETRENVWASWVAVLSGDWSYFEEEENE